MASPAEVDRLFADVKRDLGGLDVLVNNAGIAGPTGEGRGHQPEDWDRCIDVDLNGMFYCTRLAMPMLKAAGGGSIINLSSAAGRLGFPLRTPYAAAKWAVVGFTKSLSMEAGPDNIRVNCHPARRRRGRAHRPRDRRQGQGARHQLRGAEAEAARDREPAHDGEPAGHREHGAVPRQRRRRSTSPGQAISVCGDVDAHGVTRQWTASRSSAPA